MGNKSTYERLEEVHKRLLHASAENGTREKSARLATTNHDRRQLERLLHPEQRPTIRRPEPSARDTAKRAGGAPLQSADIGPFGMAGRQPRRFSRPFDLPPTIRAPWNLCTTEFGRPKDIVAEHRPHPEFRSTLERRDQVPPPMRFSPWEGITIYYRRHP